MENELIIDGQAVSVPENSEPQEQDISDHTQAESEKKRLKSKKLLSMAALKFIQIRKPIRNKITLYKSVMKKLR